MENALDATSPIAFRRARPGRKQQLEATSAKSPPHTLSSYSFPGLRRARPECRKVKGEPLDFTCFPRTDIYMKGSLATDWV